MSKGLFFTSTSLNSRTGINNGSILCHLKIFETLVSDIDCLSMYKQSNSSKVKEFVYELSGISISNCITNFSEVLEYYQNEYKSHRIATWTDIYNSLDVSTLGNYDHLYLLNGIFKPSSGFNNPSRLVGKFPNVNTGITFNSTAIMLINLLGMLKINKTFGIPVHELCYEPNGLLYKYYHQDFIPDPYYTYYGYNKDEMKRLDSSQYYLQSPKNILDDYEEEKIYDFTFGLTNMKSSPTRKPYYDYAMSLPFHSKNIFVYDKIGDITDTDRTIDKNGYIAELKKSKFTLIIPCHDKTCLSPYRFTESLQNDCIPIVHPECITSDIENSFGSIQDLIDLKDFSEENRLRLLEKYKRVFACATEFLVHETKEK